MHESVSQIENTLRDLDRVDFQLPELVSGASPSTYRSDHYEAVFNSIPIDINVLNHSYFDKKYNSIEADMVINVSFKGEAGVAATLEVCVEEGREIIHGTTSIKNYDSVPEAGTARKLKGLGRVLWKMSFVIMQKFADRLNAPVEHEVLRGQSLGLTVQKWEELFLPILEANGYIKPDKNGFSWFKTYTPQK